MSLTWSNTSYLRTQRALQWWSQRQSMHLFCEAEKIRDGLLQESFTLRRSLELLPVNQFSLLANKSQDWLKKVEKFHHSLEQLSDRLSPAYIEDSLPLAIQGVVEPWQTCNPRLKIELELPAHWRHEPPERSLVILKVLDELLRITLADFFKNISIYISLKLHLNIGELIVHISYPDLHTLVSYSSSEELEYLSQTFRFLTSGKCYRRRKNLAVAWHFRWMTSSDRFPG